MHSSMNSTMGQTTKHIIIPQGESREWVLINEPNTDWHIIQEANSSLRLHIIYLSSESAETQQWQSTVFVEHNGKECHTELYGMGLLYGEQRARVLTRVHHNKGEGYSLQLFKYVLDDRSKASFRGELKILPDAQRVEAYQTNRNILLSRQAEMLTEPNLEIYADDVKASHGATTGQLDETAIFYMQQRCIDRASAEKLLLCAFFDDVLKTLSDAQLQEKVLQEINTILQ